MIQKKKIFHSKRITNNYTHTSSRSSGGTVICSAHGVGHGVDKPWKFQNEFDKDEWEW